ncbi:alpha-L-rhamnosidase C-terminal domain-containing protein [Streptomyces sp. NPDC001480]
MIRPRPGGDVTSARATFASVHGTAHCSGTHRFTA